MEQTPKQFISKAKMLLEGYEDLLKYIIETETSIISKTKIDASSEFELVKKYYESEGIKQGLIRMVQKINEIASKQE